MAVRKMMVLAIVHRTLANSRRMYRNGRPLGMPVNRQDLLVQMTAAVGTDEQGGITLQNRRPWGSTTCRKEKKEGDKRGKDWAVVLQSLHAMSRSGGWVALLSKHNQI